MDFIEEFDIDDLSGDRPIDRQLSRFFSIDLDGVSCLGIQRLHKIGVRYISWVLDEMELCIGVIALVVVIGRMLCDTLNVSLVWVCLGFLCGGTFDGLGFNRDDDGWDEECAMSRLIASRYEVTIPLES